MRKTFNFRVSDIVFKITQHDMTEKKPGITVAYPLSYQGREIKSEASKTLIGKTFCHLDDTLNEFTGIKIACFKSLQKMLSAGISDLQKEIESQKAKYHHTVDALEQKIESLKNPKPKKTKEVKEIVQ